MASGGFSDRVAIVTGGASGIGRAIGTELARRGAEVVLADRQGDAAEQVAASIRGEGHRATAAELDVRNFADFSRLARSTALRSKRIDYLFNNAGISVGGEMDGYAIDDWNDVLDVNVGGVVHGIQAVYPVMVRQRSGHIVNTASVAGLVGAPYAGSYTASKHAVVGVSKALRIEAEAHGVRVSVLCPGAIRTPILTGGKFGRINNPNATEERVLAQWERFRPIDPDALARAALDAVAKNQAIIVVPRWWKAVWYLDRLSPALSMKIWGAVLARLRKELEAAPPATASTAAASPSTTPTTSTTSTTIPS
jgi:NAD(P)-dependent dehydrogenase (short-subunit alcohol dehydrogenase family)